ncbi:cardiolipin synthase [Paenibacillus sp. yr247]|uniref:cardiolipin synthase n=1 Tax=Paenibacillus sp. yr247 TaxID=1761880 RepID=UPI0008918C77|nr:cardiolipin synthase [Paenibacillus sp. yr247]SDP23629.1 cardiolipin synthase [Paenibacillus sp. yr247]
MAWLTLLLILFIAQIGFILFWGYKNPSKTVAWLTITFLLPFVGFVLFFFIAKDYKPTVPSVYRKLRSRLPSLLMDNIVSAEQAPQYRSRHVRSQRRLFRLLQSIPESPVTQCNDIAIYNNGNDTFAAILEALDRADHHIHMEYYIIRNDIIGRQVQQTLIRKARQGVQVRVLLDGLGSHELDEPFMKELRDAGADIRFFAPLGISLLLRKQFNYRNHRKIIVIDGNTGFLGGINIGDEYLGHHRKFGFWRDTHMKLRGDAVFFLQHTFMNDWYAVTGEPILSQEFFPTHDCAGNARLQIIPSGPDTPWNSILEVYFSAFTTAQNHIFIISPYFIPDRTILMALKTAALSGVEVKIILPEIEDHVLVKWAAYSYMEELMQAGVEFFHYKKGFIHAKIVIVDHTIASVGTANMDMRSFFDNFELNAAIYDEASIKRLIADFQNDLFDCAEVVLSEMSRRSSLQRGKEILARILSPLL